VRSRALAIFQLAFNGALVLGTFFWGWLGTVAGLTPALLAAAGTGLAMAVVARLSNLDQERILSTGQGARAVARNRRRGGRGGGGGRGAGDERGQPAPQRVALGDGHRDTAAAGRRCCSLRASSSLARSR
jgi:hypothetical protein